MQIIVRFGDLILNLKLRLILAIGLLLILTNAIGLMHDAHPSEGAGAAQFRVLTPSSSTRSRMRVAWVEHRSTSYKPAPIKSGDVIPSHLSQ
jgi:hypothetical protein